MSIDDTIRDETGQSEGRLHSGVDATRLKREPFARVVMIARCRKETKKEEQCSVD
jgi:hypothetical protein